MPELPEVEGFRRRLAPLIAGRRVARLDVLDAKLWRPAEGLAAGAVAGRAVQALDRRAKLLLFRLDGGLTLVLHLKIAGQLVFAAPDAPRLVGGHPYPLPDADLPAAATRFVLFFGAPGTLYVNDQRRFAWLRLLPDADAAAFVAEQRYGPDPLAPEFTAGVLAARLAARARRRSRPPCSTRPASPGWATSTPTSPSTPPACTPCSGPAPRPRRRSSACTAPSGTSWTWPFPSAAPW